MTDPRVSKLVTMGVSASDAALLVAAGYDTPKAIKAATDEALETVVTSQITSALRVRWPVE